MRGAVGGLGFFQPLHLQVSLAWRQKDPSKSLCVSQGRGASARPELGFHCHPSPRMSQTPPPPQAPPPPCKPRRPLASPASWRAAAPGLAPSSGWRAAAGSGQVEPDPPRSRYPHFLPRAPPSQRSRLGLQLERGQVPEWEPESAPKPGWEWESGWGRGLGTEGAGAARPGPGSRPGKVPPWPPPQRSGAALPALGPHGQRARSTQASPPQSLMGVVVFHRRPLCLHLPDFSNRSFGPRQPSEARWIPPHCSSLLKASRAVKFAVLLGTWWGD